LEAAAVISLVSGNARQDLVRDTEDTRTYLIMSDWTDIDALEAFGRSEQRDRLMAAVRDLRDSAERNTYEVRYSVPGRARPPVPRIATNRPETGNAPGHRHPAGYQP
jgi:quinol monooxygenase YgiN